MYDNEKLEAAVKAWANERLDLGFGQHYSLELFADFEDWLTKSKALQATPGRIAFGKQLTKKLGLGVKRINGLTYRTGATLKKPAPQVEPVRRPATVEKDKQSVKTTKKVARKKKRSAVKSPSQREKRKAAVKAKMKKESKQRAQGAGGAA